MGYNNDCPPSITFSLATNWLGSKVAELFLYNTSLLGSMEVKPSVVLIIDVTDVLKFWVGPLDPIIIASAPAALLNILSSSTPGFRKTYLEDALSTPTPL